MQRSVRHQCLLQEYAIRCSTLKETLSPECIEHKNQRLSKSKRNKRKHIATKDLYKGTKQTFELVHVESSKQPDSVSSPENINKSKQLNFYEKNIN